MRARVDGRGAVQPGTADAQQRRHTRGAHREAHLHARAATERAAGACAARRRRRTCSPRRPTPTRWWRCSSPDDSTYESDSAFVWHLLRDAGFEIPYADTADLPTAFGLRAERTAKVGDLVLYYDGAPYHVAIVESDDGVVSATLNGGLRRTAVRRLRRRDPLPAPGLRRRPRRRDADANRLTRKPRRAAGTPTRERHASAAAATRSRQRDRLVATPEPAPPSVGPVSSVHPCSSVASVGANAVPSASEALAAFAADRARRSSAAGRRRGEAASARRARRRARRRRRCRSPDGAREAVASAPGGRRRGHGHRLRRSRLPPAWAALVNGVLAHGIDYDDTHEEASSTSAAASRRRRSPPPKRRRRRRAFPHRAGARHGDRRAPGPRRARRLPRPRLPSHRRLRRLCREPRRRPLAGLRRGAAGACARPGRQHGGGHDGVPHRRQLGEARPRRLGGARRADRGGARRRGLQRTARRRSTAASASTAAISATAAGTSTALTRDLGRRWHLLDIALKPYPCCHMTHAFIDCAAACARAAASPPAAIAASSASSIRARCRSCASRWRTS